MRKIMLLVLVFILLTGCNSKELEKNLEVVALQNEAIANLEETVRDQVIELDKSATDYELIHLELGDTYKKNEELEMLLEETKINYDEKITTLKEENKVLYENNTNLQNLVEVKDTTIKVLPLHNDDEDNVNTISEAKFDHIVMSRFSAMSRLSFDSFYNLSNIFKLSTNYDIENDWYIISDNEFELELLDNTDALQVEFFLLKLESEFMPLSLYVDSDGTDGWHFDTSNIDQFIEPHRESGGFQFESRYVIYSEILHINNDVERSSLLPIYNIGNDN